MNTLIRITIILLHFTYLSSAIYAETPSRDDRIAFEKYLSETCPEESCMQQARIYAKYLGEGAQVMTNGKHAFVVKDGKIYDSTNPKCSGSYSGTMYAKKFYGKPSTWKELII